MTVSVALIQLECTSAEPVHARIPRAISMVERAAREGSELIVLPELWHVGAFDITEARNHAERLDGPLVADLAALARELKIWLHGGSFCEQQGDSYFNTSVVFGPDGELKAVYRKIHLFGFAGGETVLMSSGEELVVVDTPLGLTGLATCYDLRFPELFRGLTTKGATAFLVTSGWPTARIAHWDVLTSARAIENQAWVLACNEVGDQPGVSLGGHSCMVDPTGRVITRANGGEQIVRAEVDPGASATWREAFPALGDIRLI